MPKPEKLAAVEALTAQMNEASSYILVDFRGLSVAESRELRTRIRSAGGQLRVVKNTLAKRAAAEAGLEGLDSLLQGPTAIAFSRDDPAVLAKTIQGFIKEKKKLSMKGGFLQEQLLSGSQVERLATLPSREELVGKLVGGLAAPLYGLAGVLNGPIRGLAVALEQVRQQKAEAA
jgi:large subunit ribosomal protein L10